MTISSAAPRRRTAGRTRRVLLVLAAGLALTTFCTSALAFWSASGVGAGSASAATFSAPTGVSATSTAGTGQVRVTWTAPTGGAAPQGYRVVRAPSAGGTTSPACGTSATSLVTSTSCTDSSVPDGSWTYTVVAVLGNWTASSAPSSAVPVSNTVGSSTTVASSANPSVTGQKVTYTATVSAGTAVPTGPVTFKDGGVAITCSGGSQSLDSSGKATCDVTYTSAGSHTVTASYAGAGVVTGSTSDPLSQRVDKAPTTTSLSSSTNPSTTGQTVTFTATVAPTGSGAGVPTGTVSFADGPNGLACAGGANQTLSAGKATCQVAFASVSGSRSITATYAGNADFATSTSTAVSQGVNQAGTTTALDASPSTATTGQSVTLTASVKVSSPGSGTPTGTVTFKDGTVTITCAGGTPTLSAAGVATCQTSFPTTGTHTLTAVYSGDTSFAGSTSTGVTETVNPAAITTSTAVSSSANPVKTSQSVTYTATVTSGAGTPTGTVTFRDGSTNVTCSAGSSTLDASGRATCQVSYTSTGTHSISAVYNGSGAWTTSTSSSLSQRVVNGNVAGIGFSSITVDTTTSSCGAASATYTCNVSATTNKANFSFTPAFVSSTGAPAAYSADAQTINWTNGTTSGSVTVPAGQTASTPLTWQQNGNGSMTYTFTFTDGPISYSTTLNLK